MPPQVPFRKRAREVSRLEAFSDVIFGFAISLLVVSLEAPKSYEELMEMMRGFLPFAICFFLFIDIWFEHHAFFRRYALEDSRTIAVNTVLLFVILFYVYPLKFMFVRLVDEISGHHHSDPLQHYQRLFTIYGAGFTLVFWLIALLYMNAYRQRESLRLDAVERIDTRESIYDNFFSGCFGLASVAVAHSPWFRLAGPVYFFIFIPKTLVPLIMGRKRRRMEETALAEREAVLE